MGIGKAYALGGQTIHVRSVNPTPLATVAFEVANAEVVGQDEYNVGSLGRESGKGKQD
jgi:hypothetical protein